MPPDDGIPDDSAEWDYPPDDGPTRSPDWSVLFTAPDYADLVKPKTSGIARDYERKTQSMLKSLLFAALNAQNVPDAAAIIDKGPSFAAAAGQLAAADERARRALDMLTSPGSAHVAFLITALGLVSQVLRNHESDVTPVITDLPKRFTREARAARKATRIANRENDTASARIKLPFGKSIRIGVRFRPARFARAVVSPFRASTVPPDALVYRVFSDDKVREALAKQGFHLRGPG